ncbi:MAG: protein kinase [Acidobacteriota bacterium]|nr:protein kinase [Acidobacteriota bacterium]
MSLPPGSRIGPYEVVAELGAGGMGQVYRAHDSKLHRDVAIKVLLAAVASDPDRLARFSREAQVLASLNHPNIAAIYGLEEGPAPFDGAQGREAGRQTSALVMELVEGSTLADRLVTGPLPLDEAIAIASQIADALQAAHESGIIHRDLKPANIKVRPDGTVKVLDFGLAKALDPEGGSSANAMNSPTLSVHGTQMGVILGTAAYMSPEQARGRAVDRRADIWAFGVVLFEMLAGRRAFEGDDISITLASVLKDDMKWDALPDDLPTPLRRLLRRCLEKDPKRRLSSIGDARLELDDAITSPSENRISAAPVLVAAPVARSVVPWTLAALATIAAATAIVMWAPWRVVTDPPQVLLELPTSTTDSMMMALSPDGRHIATRVQEQGIFKLALRRFDRLTGATLPGTDAALHPFWSADGRHIGFFADGKLKRVDLLGAAPQSLADATLGRGGSWNRDGVILFTPDTNGPLFRIPATGGKPVQVSELNRSRAETAHRFPRFLPDGIHFLYWVESANLEQAGIYVGSLNSQDGKFLVSSRAKPEFAPPDQLLFLRENTLMAQRLDLARLELSGDPVQVSDQVSLNNSGAAGIAASETGVLAYMTGGSGGGRRLNWVDRLGKVEATIGAPALYENPRLSPDGKRLAIFKPDGGGDIWVIDLERDISARFTFDSSSDNIPVWSPDGSRIAFVSNRNGGVFNLYQKNSGNTGEDELLLKSPNNKSLHDWSADGRYILYEEEDPVSRADLWVLPLFGDRKPIKIMGSPFGERQGTFSPDGRWIAYVSDEGGGVQVFVQSFPASGSKWQMSSTRGSAPRWRADGKELYYDRTGTLMAVDLTGTMSDGPLKAGTPQELFRGLQNVPPHNYDLSPDGRRFLVVSSNMVLGASPPIIVMFNWKSGLKP